MKERKDYLFVLFAQLGDLDRMKKLWNSKQISNIDCFGKMNVGNGVACAYHGRRYIFNVSDHHDYCYIIKNALHWACSRGHIDIVRFLLENGSDVNVLNDPPVSVLFVMLTCCDKNNVRVT